MADRLEDSGGNSINQYIPMKDMAGDEPQQSPPQQNSSFFRRTFKKFDQGSLRGSIFTLAATAIGSGCLSIPLAFRYIGIVLGPLLLMLTATTSIVSLTVLASAAFKHKVFDYSMLVEKILGKGARYTLATIMTMYLLGTLIGYEVMVGIFGKSILSSFGADLGSIGSALVMVAMTLGVMTPLCLLRDLTSLRHVSIVSAVTLIYIALLLIIELPLSSQDNDWGDLQYANINTMVFSAFAFCLYSFVCHGNICQITGELARPSVKRLSKTIFRATLLLLILFSIIGVFGYLGNLDLKVLVIMRPTPNALSNDWAMIIARCMMLFTITAAVPLNIPPLRNIIFRQILRIEGQPRFLWHAVVSLSLLYVALLVGVLFPEILFLFSFLGGFCSIFVVVLFPTAIYMKDLNTKPMKHPVNIIIITAAVFLSLLGFSSVVFSVIAMVS
jgi:amino acid permease